MPQWVFIINFVSQKLNTSITCLLLLNSAWTPYKISNRTASNLIIYTSGIFSHHHFFGCELSSSAVHSLFPEKPTSIWSTGDALLELEEGSARGDSAWAKAGFSSSDSSADMMSLESLSVPVLLINSWLKSSGLTLFTLPVFLFRWVLWVETLSRGFLTGFDECESGCFPVSSLSESLSFQQIDSSSVSGSITDKIQV